MVVVLRQKVVRAIEALYGDRRGPLEQQLCVLCTRGCDRGVRHRVLRSLPSCRLQRRPVAGGSLVWNVTVSVRLPIRVGHHERALSPRPPRAGKKSKHLGLRELDFSRESHLCHPRRKKAKATLLTTCPALARFSRGVRACIPRSLTGARSRRGTKASRDERARCRNHRSHLTQ